MGRHWRRTPQEFDLSVPLPSPEVRRYLLLAVLAAAAFGMSVIAFLRTT